MRVTLALLFLFCAWAVAVPGGADGLPTADEVEARAKAAAGPIPDNFRETILGAGSLGDTKSVSYHAGKDVRLTFDRGAYHSESGTYHGEHWRSDYNGLAVAAPEDPGNAAKDAITTTVTHVTQPFDAYVIAKLNAEGSGTRSFYDAATYLCRRIEYTNTTGTVVATYDVFGKFGDRTLPVRWSLSSGSAQNTMRYQRLQYSENKVSDDDVRAAVTLRELVEFPAGVNAVDLPVKIINHYIYVRVNIGTVSADLLLDSGASGIFIDPQLARSAGLTLTNATSEVVAKRFTAFDATIPEMHIGPLQMHDIAVSVVPMPPFSTEGVKPLGLLGFDFLAQLGVTLDYQHGKVHVVPASAFTPPADPSTYAFDVRMGNGVPMLAVAVTGALAERVMCDTGWGGSLAFFDYFARRYPKAFTRDLGPAARAGVGGTFIAENFRFHDVKMGRLHFEDFLGLRIPPENFPGNNDGIIGNSLLSLFTVTLDYTSGHMYLTPNDVGRKAISPLR
jgi:predicted aspartyl protease